MCPWWCLLDRITLSHLPTKRYLKYTINISMLVKCLNYLFMAMPCLHQGWISWQVWWLMIQQVVKQFFHKNECCRGGDACRDWWNASFKYPSTALCSIRSFTFTYPQNTAQNSEIWTVWKQSKDCVGTHKVFGAPLHSGVVLVGCITETDKDGAMH